MIPWYLNLFKVFRCSDGECIERCQDSTHFAFSWPWCAGDGPLFRTWAMADVAVNGRGSIKVDGWYRVLVTLTTWTGSCADVCDQSFQGIVAGHPIWGNCNLSEPMQKHRLLAASASSHQIMASLEDDCGGKRGTLALCIHRPARWPSMLVGGHGANDFERIWNVENERCLKKASHASH